MSTNLSAIIIAKNEEQRIAKCLESVAFANERIVVDNGSTDQTVQLAKEHGAKVFTVKEKDFSVLRELGLREATGTWVLYIDADEEVGEKLQKEIQHVIRSGSKIGYFIKRNTYFLGRHWPYQDKVERLFLRDSLRGWHGTLHETPLYVGTIGALSNPLVHRTHRTLEEMVAKTNEWSRLEAKLRLDAHHPPVVWWRLLRVMITGFGRSFFTQGGWKAGTVGWIESVYQGFSMFITYAKLWEMQQKKKS
ncbi:MAG: glycosyltransferase family 2 protein [Candidatus Gottesmanbacteria bacterium]|nr:glycosyltransferase family 2 protein [Candidatus Gottesmanbacteria bacterium]